MKKRIRSPKEGRRKWEILFVSVPLLSAIPEIGIGHYVVGTGG